MARPKKDVSEKKDRSVKRKVGRPSASKSAVAKIMSSGLSKESKIEKLLEERKRVETVPLKEYEYNLRLGVVFGVLIGVVLTTYLWMFIDIVYFWLTIWESLL